MYNIVKNWDWGNMGSSDIYHDPETRKNSITYRSNLARLTENLLREGDTIHAEEILDLGMKNMPVEYYEYYTLLEPFITGYYEVNEPQKAREIWEKVVAKYQENLKFYSGWEVERQYRYADEIITDMERYRGLVDIMMVYEDRDTAREKAEEFNQYLKMFRHFYREDEEIDAEPRSPQEEIMEALDGAVPVGPGTDSISLDSVEN